MSVKDFKSFPKGRIPMGMNVPIIGSQPPAQVRDQFNRILGVGDFIDVRTPGREPYRIMEVVPAPQDAGGAKGMMIVTVTSTIQFLAQRDIPDSTFLRVMTAEEVVGFKAEKQRIYAPDADVKAVGGEFVGKGSDGASSESEVGEAATPLSEGQERVGEGADQSAVQQPSEVPVRDGE